VERYIELVLSRRWLVAVLATLIMLAIASGARFVTVSNDYRTLFSEEDPKLAALDALENTYSTSELALIAVTPQDGTVFTRETLGAIEALTDAAWQTPYSNRVDSLTNYSHSEASEDDLVVAPLVKNASSLSDAGLERVEKIALGAPAIAGRLVSHDGRVGGVAIKFILPENMDQAVAEITDYLQDMLQQARASHPQLSYHLTGSVVMHRAFSDATKNDLRTLTPFVFLVIVAVTIVLLRSILGTLSIVAMILFVVNTTMGFAGWLNTTFSPTNAGVPIIIMTITVAHCVHIVTTVQQGMRRGLERNAAIAESIRINFSPVFLTSLTTMIGFLSLNASDSPPFHILGNFVAFGVFCAFIYSMTLLPALLSILPLRASTARTRKRDPFALLADFVIARRTLLLWCFVLVAALLVAGIPRNELTDNWTRYFDDRYEFRRDTDYVMQNLTGLDLLEYSLDAGREGGITDPGYLQKVETFANWYREQPEVFHVRAFPDIMKRLNKNMHGDDPGYYRLPEDPELAAQYLLLYELSLPVGLDLNDRMDVAKSATRMTVVVRSISTQELRGLDQRAQAWLQTHQPDLATEASGISVAFAHVTERNIRSMLRGTVIAMALISLILILVFRSLYLGAVSLVPNFVPAAMSFGMWGHLVGHVGLASSVVVAVAFGIIVDDTIHFLSKYVKSRQEGLHATEAVRAAFQTVGRALATTTAVLSAGFLVFALSGFEISWALGLLVAITITFALAADFLLLPTLLIATDRRKNS